MSGAATEKIVSELRRHVQSQRLAGRTLVVAVSGGPDSLALLHGLYMLSAELQIELYGAHMNHSLRSRSSDADEEFVRETMAAMGVELAVDRADVARFRDERRLSLEDAARRLRYRFLARIASERGASAVALGHTLDDQAETALMHLIRGSGLDGLRAMRPMSVMSSIMSGMAMESEPEPVSLFRPMLAISKSETAAYCAENGLDARLDESNLSTDLTRNRIRLELMPMLEQYNPSVATALARLSDSAAVDADFIEKELDRAWEDAVSVRCDAVSVVSTVVSIDRRRFSALHLSIRRRMARRAFGIVSGGLADLTLAHVGAMLEAADGPTGSRIDLPGSVRLESDYDSILLMRVDSDDCPFPSLGSTPVPLIVPGVVSREGWRLTARYTDAPPRAESVGDGMPMLRETIDYDCIGERLAVRVREPGDLFQPLGMTGYKNLADFMTDAHIPRRWRDRVPIVESICESGSRIVWVVGWRIADWAKVTRRTRRMVELRYSAAGVAERID